MGNCVKKTAEEQPLHSYNNENESCSAIPGYCIPEVKTTECTDCQQLSEELNVFLSPGDDTNSAKNKEQSSQTKYFLQTSPLDTLYWPQSSLHSSNKNLDSLDFKLSDPDAGGDSAMSVVSFSHSEWGIKIINHLAEAGGNLPSNTRTQFKKYFTTSKVAQLADTLNCEAFRRSNGCITNGNLGFATLNGDLPTKKMCWIRYGEIEKEPSNNVSEVDQSNCGNSQKSFPNFQQPVEEKVCSSDAVAKFLESARERVKLGTSRKGDGDRSGWYRYTMFLNTSLALDCVFANFINRTKHALRGLETITGCEIRISAEIFLFRANYVRCFVIDGPSKASIMRCRNSLPIYLANLLIQDCEDAWKAEILEERKKQPPGPSAYPSLKVLLHQTSKFIVQQVE